MKTTIGGFHVKDLGTTGAKPDPIAKCYSCQQYSTQSKMTVKNKKNYCSNCSH